jgi:hypothetical protein
MRKAAHDGHNRQGTGERGGDLTEADKRRWREHNAMVGSPYIVVHHVRQMCSCGQDGTGRRLVAWCARALGAQRRLGSYVKGT